MSGHCDSSPRYRKTKSAHWRGGGRVAQSPPSRATATRWSVFMVRLRNYSRDRAVDSVNPLYSHRFFIDGDNAAINKSTGGK